MLLPLLLPPLLSQTLLQMSQLRRELSSSQQSGTTWQVLGNTVVMGPLNTPDVETAINNRGFLADTLLSVSSIVEGDGRWSEQQQQQLLYGTGTANGWAL